MTVASAPAHALDAKVQSAISDNSGNLFGDPAVMVGLVWKFGGAPSEKDIGMSVKVLSNSEEDNATLAAGATLYPFADFKFGLDVGFGYNFTNATVTGGLDLLQLTPQLGIGWSSTEKPAASMPPG